MTTTDQNRAAKQIFATLEDAKAVTPSSKSFRVYQTTRKADGLVRFTWAEGTYTAQKTITDADGYETVLAVKGSRGPVKKTIPADLRGFLTEEQIAAKEAEYAAEHEQAVKEWQAKRAAKEAEQAADESDGVPEQTPPAEQEEPQAEEPSGRKGRRTRPSQQGKN